MAEETTTPAPKVEAKAPEFDIEELNKEIDAANKKLVSEEVSKLLAAERETARKEAEKEFLINQKLKDKEQELERIKQAQLVKEKETAQQLEQLRKKLDDMAASKQGVTVQNPFGNNAPPVNAGKELPSILKLKEDELEEVEKASFYAMLERKSPK